MHTLKALLVATIATAAHAHVLDRRGNSAAAFCSKVDKLVTAAHQQAAATSFCASYLSISQATSATSTSTTTTSTFICATTAADKKRREAAIVEERGSKPKKPEAKPSCLSTFSAAAIISSACSCLSIAPSTTTSTSTSTSTITVLQTPNSFLLYYQDGAGAGNAQYALNQNTDVEYDVQPGDGSVFSLNGENLVSNGVDATYLDYDNMVHFDSQGDLLSCSIGIVENNGEQVCGLACTVDGQSTSEVCPSSNVWEFAGNAVDQGCEAFTPLVASLD